MKRLLFIIVSAFIAMTSFAANVTESISNVFGNNEESQVEKQGYQTLVLQKFIDNVKKPLGWHYSHGSHYSHSNHGSHYSHSNHGSHYSHSNHGSHYSHSNHGSHYSHYSSW